MTTLSPLPPYSLFMIATYGTAMPERAPSTTSDSAAVLNCRERQLILRWLLPSRRMPVTAALGHNRTKQRSR
jgi:hypothetical protein